MPNRILRDGILTSTRINLLDAEEEVFFRRLMSVVDDYGRCEAHTALLRASLYPLKLDKVKEATVERWLGAVVAARLLILYQVGDKRFLEIINFRQQTRSNSKHPPASAAHMISDAKQMISDDAQPIADAKQVKSFAHLGVVGGVVGDVVVSEGGKRSGAESRPASLEDVKVYASEIGMPHAEAEKFYDHFQANGWRQGGRTALRDWKAACRNWGRRSGEFAPRSAQKNRAGGGATAEPFNPNMPNAHTGGYPVFNDEPAPAAAPSAEGGA